MLRRLLGVPGHWQEVYCGHRSGWRDHSLLEIFWISLEWPWFEVCRGKTDTWLYLFNFVWRWTSKDGMHGSPGR
jgi:hypothetical protein